MVPWRPELDENNSEALIWFHQWQKARLTKGSFRRSASKSADIQAHRSVPPSTCVRHAHSRTKNPALIRDVMVTLFCTPR